MSAPPGTSCFLSEFSERPCDGRLVRCHLLPKRLLRQVWRETHHGRTPSPERTLPFRSLDALTWDPRAWVWGCGGPIGNSGHHGELDHSRTLKIPFARIPAGTLELAELIGLGWFLDREYGGVTA